MPHILVTGGAGYIGSHTVVQLLEAGYRVTIIDNLCNSNVESLRRVIAITGKEAMLEFHKVDLMDTDGLDDIFARAKYDAVIHFAALKSVGESVSQPLKYYKNNLTGTFNLLEAMNKANVKNIVFSSSATVYGDAPVPLTEESTVGHGITNPYGRTKFMMEEVLRDLHTADSAWNIVLLRYFNPVGAHPSGLIGEDPQGIPNNLMPYVQQVAIGRREFLTIHGSDYDTPDGTGVRDYIHVQDLAAGHLKALTFLARCSGNTCEVFNLGTGTGYSVLEMVHAMEAASGRPVAYKVGPRRPGDLGAVYCNPTKAQRVLGWNAKLGLQDMCATAWKWQSLNPSGFSSSTAAPAPAAPAARKSAAAESSPSDSKVSPIRLPGISGAGASPRAPAGAAPASARDGRQMAAAGAAMISGIGIQATPRQPPADHSPRSSGHGRRAVPSTARGYSNVTDPFASKPSWWG